MSGPSGRGLWWLWGFLGSTLWTGCGEEPPKRLVSEPGIRDGSGAVEVPVDAVVLDEGREPLQPSAWTVADLVSPSLDVLETRQGRELMGALNTLASPCSPCWDGGLSYASCIREAPSECLALHQRLLDRGVGLATGGAQTRTIYNSLRYDDAWFAVPWEELTQAASGWGSDDAPIRVVFVIDLQSPFCARISDSWQQLLERGGENLAVRILYWSEDRHPRSRPAALAAEAAAAQGKQWAYTRLLLSRYQHLQDSDLLVAASELGLVSEDFERIRRAPATAERLDAQRVLAERLGVRSAPTLFVDGFRQRGARPHPQLASILERAMVDRAVTP